ncbi:type II toxin-antitoxin system RelE/ParE family toxin [Candidatus Roizmanbacteria bacterium]|nr:type II toxin-antitoxin system RelE/ParE family toxin [Candidatus Roizmanbacteria bacterium]
MKIIITPEAIKQYGKLPKVEQKKIKRKITILEQDPKAGKKLSGNFSELRSLRVWPYRILYYINESQNTIYVVTIAHRQGAYKR